MVPETKTPHSQISGSASTEEVYSMRIKKTPAKLRPGVSLPPPPMLSGTQNIPCRFLSHV